MSYTARQSCGLCELKTVIHTYDESDSRWIIMDCMSCFLPMAVWRGKPLHTMTVSEADRAEMEESLRKVAFEKFGNDQFWIDKVQHRILDHLHWHARPNGWKPRLRYRILDRLLRKDSKLYCFIEKALAFIKK